VTEERLEFKRMTGGYVAENHHRHYAIYSGWGYRSDLKAEGFIWTLEVREKTETLGRRNVVGQPVIYRVERHTRGELLDLAQRFERSILEALRSRV